MKYLDTYDGPVWRYRSPYRPITQLPLAKLDFVIDYANRGPEVRILITARELTDAEIRGYELEPIPMEEEYR